MKLQDEEILSMHMTKDMIRSVEKGEANGMIIARALISERMLDKALKGNLKAMEMYLKINGLDQEKAEVDTEIQITRQVV